MILFKLAALAVCVVSFVLSSEPGEDYYIRKTNEKFNLVDDYRVDMTVRLEIPAFRMPKKKYRVFYKKPNKVKVKARGFGILPKTGLFTSPNDNFDNLSNIKVSEYSDPENLHDVLVVGDLIVDSLKLDMPNEYSRITFDPTVEVKIDTMRWVIKSVTTRLDTLKLFQISNFYGEFDGDFYMPYQSVVKYYVKDKKLFNWLNKDAGSIIGKDGLPSGGGDMVEGTITVDYKKYTINKGIEDKVFD